MDRQVKIPEPELEARVREYVAGVAGGNVTPLTALASSAAAEQLSAIAKALSDKLPLQTHELLACARIGHQYVVKIRWLSAKGEVLLQTRWRREAAGGWKIADIEDLTSKRSPWADIPKLKAEFSSSNKTGGAQHA